MTYFGLKRCRETLCNAFIWIQAASPDQLLPNMTDELYDTGGSLTVGRARGRGSCLKQMNGSEERLNRHGLKGRGPPTSRWEVPSERQTCHSGGFLEPLWVRGPTPSTAPCLESRCPTPPARGCAGRMGPDAEVAGARGPGGAGTVRPAPAAGKSQAQSGANAQRPLPDPLHRLFSFRHLRRCDL